MTIGKEVQEIISCQGNLGVPPNPFLPQEWGIEGVDNAPTEKGKTLEER